MPSFRLGKRSRAALVGVHPDLVRVIERAIQITPVDFVVLEGLRTEARQRELVAAGASRTMRSRHITGHAVDLGALFDGVLTWRSEAYRRLAPHVKRAARLEGAPIEWGGDWVSFVDLVHFQLPRREYPAA